MKLLVEQHPDRDIRILLQKPNTRIAKGSPTTYAAWCEKHGIPWLTIDQLDELLK